MSVIPSELIATNTGSIFLQTEVSGSLVVELSHLFPCQSADCNEEESLRARIGSRLSIRVVSVCAFLCVFVSSAYRCTQSEFNSSPNSGRDVGLPDSGTLDYSLMRPVSIALFIQISELNKRICPSRHK